MNQVSQVAIEKLQSSIAGCSSVLSLGQCYKLDIGTLVPYSLFRDIESRHDSK